MCDGKEDGAVNRAYIGQAAAEAVVSTRSSLEKQVKHLEDQLDWRRQERRNTAVHLALQSFAGLSVGASEIIARAAVFEKYLANGDA